MRSLLDGPRRWLIATVFVCLVIALLGWFLVISPTNGRAASASEELTQIQDRTASLQQKAASLTKQSEELDAKRNELQTLSEKLPDDAGVAQILNQISSASARAGVTVNSFTPGAPTPLVAPVPAAAATADTSGSEGDTPSAAPSAAPVSKLSYVPVTIAVEGTPTQVSAFVTNLENITRAMLITNLDLTSSAGEQGSTLTANIQGRIFMRPTGTGKTTASASPSPAAS